MHDQRNPYPVCLSCAEHKTAFSTTNEKNRRKK